MTDMSASGSLTLPPVLTTASGAARRIGVEIEFAGLDAAATAAIVHDLFGGTITCTNPHFATVTSTRFGDFEIELDSSYAHPKPANEAAPLRSRLEAQVAETVGDVVSAWMPYEVVAPPVGITDLPEMDRLAAALRDAAAKGTRSNPIYGFGIQLNPEVPTIEADDLCRHLQAYLTLSPWLRRVIDLDATRRLLPFADPFPEAYVRQVLTASYAPSLETLIDDYIAGNPTRNRELDLLPLFAHLDPDRVRAKLQDEKIKPRPTFHYRLPNSSIDEPDWVGIVGEWNRWVEVERLAADPERLRATADQYLASLKGPLTAWVEQVKQWVGA